MNDIVADISVDITGLKCPIPLIKTRRAVLNAEKGQIIEFIGTPEEEISRKEILLAIESLKQKLLEILDVNDENKWRILIEKT
ncbi:MAG: sulfurtransferase TusA family protein [Candidatus Hodarchaeota archaeon]